MEEIIKKLSDIEDTASQVMEKAAAEKQRLSMQFQQQCREYDQQAEKAMEEQVRKIRAGLAKDQGSQLAKLREQMEEEHIRMERYYTQHHRQIAQDIYKKIIHA